MKITVENLGKIKQGNIEIPSRVFKRTGGMTILAGANNSGKSYMSYLIYGFYKMRDYSAKYNNIYEKYETNIEEYLFDKIDFEQYFAKDGIRLNFFKVLKKHYLNYEIAFEKSLEESCYQIFSDKNVNYKIGIEDLKNEILAVRFLNENDTFRFRGVEYKVKFIEEKAISITSKEHKVANNSALTMFVKLLFLLKSRSKGKDSPMFFPAERSSINLFSKEIFREKAMERDELARKIQMGEDFEKVLTEYKNKGTFVPRYPLAVSDYIYFVNDLRYAVEQPETEFADLADDLEAVMQGSVKLSNFGDLQFAPSEKGKNLPLHLSSSLVKSLSGMVIYFRHLAQAGDTVMIDEPELNLHPENQVRLARVLAKIANRGFNLIFSTHSDYILKELSNLTIMANDFEGKAQLTAQYGYDEKSFLPKDKIKVYAFQNETIEAIEITETGFDLDKIDEVISDMTERSDNIFYSFTESNTVHG